MVGRLVVPGDDAGRARHEARRRLARRRRATSSARASSPSIDDRTCIVQFALRVAQFYMHESCGKCTPCRVGTRWLVQILRAVEDGTATESDFDLLARRLRPDHRQVPVRARRLGRDAGRELRDEVPRRVPRAPRARRLPLRRATRRSTGIVRAGRPARAHAVPQEVPRMSTPSSSASRSTSATSTSRRGRASSRPRSPPASRSPSSVTSRGSATPIGACRMCLVEIEGMPKLQAGCTLTAQDGMVVKTARTSAKAAEGQNATLEFILVNHPLDCPVCDKGGECPLQDLTFRYGPGNTRMSFEKLDLREADPDLADDLARPRALHPLLPLHALQRGRERGRPARRANRGAMSVITTFEDEPYTRRVHRQRHRALPRRRAAADAVPLRGAAVGDRRRADRLRACAPSAATRQRRPCARARSKRILLAQPPRDRRGLDLRQGPLRASRTCAPTTASSIRSSACGGAASSRSRGTTRSTRPSGCCAPRTAASSSRSPAPRRSSRRTRSAKLVRAGPRLARGDAAGGGLRRARRVPAAALRDPRRADVVVVLGDVPLVESAPIVDLWVRKARAERRDGSSTRVDDVGERASASCSIWSGPGGRGGATRRAARREARPRRPGGLRRLLRPRDAERPRRRRRVGRRAPTRRRGDAESIGAADRLGRRGGRRPERARARRAAPRR